MRDNDIDAVYIRNDPLRDLPRVKKRATKAEKQ